MIIKKIELYKFKRFFLSQVDHFVLEPKSNIMIMAWGNGKGKSSLLSVLNPLPAELKKDFKEDGYKYIEILHRGHEYKISSGKLEKNKHSFIQDDKELNPGGTKRVQLELVKEHFNITPAINNVVLGLDKFSIMSPSTRKYWFSELSTIDYTYPVKVYNSLKARYRDLLGGIKLQEENIGKITSNVLKEDELENLKEQRSKLEEYITYIISLHNHDVDLEVNTNVISELTKVVNDLRNLTSQQFRSNDLNYYLSNISKVEANIETLVKDIKDIHHKLHLADEIAGTPNQDLEALQTSRRDKIIKILELRKHSNGKVPLYKIDQIRSAYNDMYIYIMDIVNKLNDMERVHVSLEAIRVNEKKLEELTNLQQITQRKLDKVEGEYDALARNTNSKIETTCPQCKTVYSIDLGETKKYELTTIIDKYKKELSLIVEQHKKLTKDLEDKLNIKNSIDDIKLILEQRSILKSIANIISSKIDYNTATNTIITIIDTYKRALDMLVSYTELRKELTSIAHNIAKIKSANKAKIDLHAQNVKMLEQELEIKTLELNKSRELLASLVSEKDKVTHMKELVTKLKQLLKQQAKIKKAAVVQLRNKYLTELVGQLKTLLVEYDQKLLQNVQSRSLLDRAVKDIEEYKERVKVIGHMLDALSPSDGIIARSINSFLNIFIKEMNHIINSVWSYEMTILPCDVSEDDDLDYKFKVKVNNDEVIEDVSRLSSSMQEIVDLAYKIVFMKYMGLSDSPLILDEFGRTMDATHRDTAYNIIDRVFSSNFNQIFLVSHFESMYGRFVNADLVQLEDTK